MFDRALAEILLSRCQGDEIWSLELCRELRVPEGWILELSHCFESGFDHDRNSIYEEGRLTNQYYGVRDLDLAYRAAEELGIEIESIRRLPLDRKSQVERLKAALDEL